MAPAGGQSIKQIFSNMRVSSFWRKIEVFYRPEPTKEGTSWKLILSIFRLRNVCYKQSEKSRWKNWSHLSSFHVPFLTCGPEIVLKSAFFLNIGLASARNLSLLKQFTYIHLKGLVTHFQKMVLFIMLWLTVLEILVFEVEEFC